MKVVIDARMQTDRGKPFFAIRLFPETNEEMASLEWGRQCGFIPQELMVIPSAAKSVNYSIIFRQKGEK